MNVDEIRELLAGLDREELLRVAQVATRMADRQLVATHRVANDPQMTPRYLAGTPGRVGGWHGRRRTFYPLPGTAAYQRNREWRVSAHLLIPLPQKES